MKLRVPALTLFVGLALAAFVYPRPDSNAAEPTSEVASQQGRRTRTRARPRPATTRTTRRNYAKFSHRIPQHTEQACNACHKFPTANWNKARNEGEAFEDVTDYPSHPSCLNCHHQQFFSGARPPICTICHTNPSPRDSSRHPFPNPTEVFDKSPKGLAALSEFQISFPHDKHEGLLGLNGPGFGTESRARFLRVSMEANAGSAQAKDTCSTCHQTYQPQGDSDVEFVTPPPKDLPEEGFWLKKGTFKTTPASHETCFSCHTADSGIEPAPPDCARCHKLLPTAPVRADFDPQLAATMGIKDKTTLEKWRKRDVGKYRHEWFSHAELSCAACHDVTRLNTVDDKTKKVPITSCGGGGAGCHIGEPDSALNDAVEKKKADPNFQCTKCHVIFGRDPVPPSHIDAVIR